MALIDKDKTAHLPDKVKTGLVFDHNGTEKAIVLTGQMGKPTKMKRHKVHWWPEAKKVEAATLYAATGSLTRVCELTKIPRGTLERWCTEDWWLVTLQKVRREKSDETDAKFTKLVDKALSRIEQRIEDGDYVYDIKRGIAVAMPVSARDLTLVTGTLFDKRQLIRGEATSIKAAVSSEEHLKQLADQFTQYVKERMASKERVVNYDPDLPKLQVLPKTGE